MKRIAELAKMDLYDEDGFRAWSKESIAITKDLMNEFSFTAETLYQILCATPVSNPRGGVMGMGNDSKFYARKVRAHLRRASQSLEFAGGQIAGGWSQFENGFLVPASRGQHRGMNIKGA